MRSYDAATQAALDSGNVVAHRLVWITARALVTGDPVSIGVWSGEDDTTFTVDGVARGYTGAGQILEGDPIAAGVGLDVRIHQIRLAAASAEIEDLVKGYDTRFAPVEMHRALIDPETRLLVAPPHRVFRGIVNRIDFPRAVPGGQPSCEIDLASQARALTRVLATKKSDESQKARGGDRLRRYGNVSGSVPVYWGEMRLAPPADPAPVPPAHVSNAQNREDER